MPQSNAHLPPSRPAPKRRKRRSANRLSLGQKLSRRRLTRLPTAPSATTSAFRTQLKRLPATRCEPPSGLSASKFGQQSESLEHGSAPKSRRPRRLSGRPARQFELLKERPRSSR